MEITYQSIAPFIVLTEMDDSTMYCEFQTPSGEIVTSESRIKRSNSTQSQIERTVKRVLVNQARRSASRLLRQALGGGVMGRVGSSVMRTATRSDNLGINFTEEEKKMAIVEAFRRVAHYFPTDDQQASQQARPTITIRPKDKPATVAAESTEPEEELSAFEQQLMKCPLENVFEKEILSRILVELAHADGQISEEEREFLDDLIPPELGDVSRLLMMDPVSPVECSEVSAGGRETIFMAAWVLSTIDIELDPAEESLLLEYADMFSLPDQAASRIIQAAKAYVLENHIDTSIRREDLFELADRIGLSHAEAERCLIRLKKKQ